MRVLKILFISVLLLSTNSCFLYNGPEDDDSNTEISGEIVDAPNWDLSDYSIYECNMTVNKVQAIYYKALKQLLIEYKN